MSQRDRVSAPIPDRSATDVLFNSMSPASEAANGRPTITDRMREWEKATAEDETQDALTRAADILFAPSASNAAEGTPAPDLEGLREWRQQIKDEVVADEPEPERLKAPPAPKREGPSRWQTLLDLRRDEALVVAEPEHRGLVAETVLVLGVSLGASAIRALLMLIDIMTRQSLSQTTVYINNSYTPDRPWLDLTNQLVHVVLTLVPVALAFYLLATVRRPAAGPVRVMGLTLRNVPRDVALGVALAAGIGIPGLGFYAISRALGINATIAAGNLSAHWWTIPMYVLLAAMNGILEEVVMVGYLFTRWGQRGWGPWPIIVGSALIRGGYHLYQGFGGFIGNAVMGVVFGWVYTRTKRVLPLIIAHTVLDIVSFIGYALLVSRWTWLGPAPKFVLSPLPR